MNGYNYIFKYIICLCLLYLSLFLFVSVNDFSDEPKNFEINLHDFEKRSINIERNGYTIDAYYPKFASKEITDEIKSFIYSYINNFISNNGKALKINYEIYFKDEFVNVFFTIDNSLNDMLYYKSFNYKINESLVSVVNSYDIDFEKVLDLLSIKYSSEVVNKIKSLSLDDYNFKFTDKGVHVYFNFDLFDTPYVPELYLDYNNEVLIESTNERKKMIAFTFDDGPGDYTKDLVDTLKINNSTATFFMLGNRMKYNQSAVLYATDNGMEIGSHSYSHKNLDKISEEELEEEINSTTIIYNEITGKNIKLFRPPYGNSKSSVREKIPFAIIKWNIDTQDWLYRDSKHTYEHIIANACDGCIVLMHEIYKETLEAVKMSIPALQEMGYDIVSVSELADSKEITLVPGTLYKSFNNYNLPF